jgi:CheY-like chemotaxis protein
VLYLDDNPDSLEIVKVILENSGKYSVDTTPSAIEALNLVREKVYDVILSDYRMVRMDGREFLSRTREIKPGIPFIFFTGMDPDEVAVASSREEAVLYLQKRGDPAVQFAELEQRIHILVGHRGSPSP